jgi:hypothetical protein
MEKKRDHVHWLSCGGSLAVYCIGMKEELEAYGARVAAQKIKYERREM